MKLNVLTKGIPKLLMDMSYNLPEHITNLSESIFKRIVDITRFNKFGGSRPLVIFFLGDNTVEKELVCVDIMYKVAFKDKGSIFICGSTYDGSKIPVHYLNVLSQVDDIKPNVIPMIRDAIMTSLHNNRLVILSATSEKAVEMILGKSIYDYIATFTIEVYSPFKTSIERIRV